MKEDNKIKELRELSKPLVEYLRQNYHPHAKIIITDDNVELVETTLGLGFHTKH